MASDQEDMAEDGAPLRLFLCDDTEPFRALMREVLPDAGFVVVGEAADGGSVVEGVLDTAADVVLLDLAMPRFDGMSAIEMLRDQVPACAIVVFSGFSSEAMADRCSELGAHAYVEKGTSVEDVRIAIRRAVTVQRSGSTRTGAWADGLQPAREHRNVR